MPRDKHIDTGPRPLAGDLSQQLLPGTFEHALNHLLDHEIDRSHFDRQYSNDNTGASAYPPAMLLKVVLFGYSQGTVSSRGIERACRDQVIFIALSGESCPHFTTIASFVSTLGEDIAKVFGCVLSICQRQGLIGREMFAIAGVKLPSNASKRRSGTRAEFKRQAATLEAAAKAMLECHRDADAKALEPSLAQREAKRIERLTREAAQIKQWLKDHPKDRKDPKGTIRKSNRTENDSDEGRHLYGQRFATVEPVFGNIRHNKRMNRFTLRGKTEDDGQWKLFCLVHNIEKLAHHRYAQ